MLKKIWNIKKSYKKCQNYVKNEEIYFSFLVPQFLVRNFSYGNSSISRFSQETMTCIHNSLNESTNHNRSIKEAGQFSVVIAVFVPYYYFVLHSLARISCSLE